MFLSLTLTLFITLLLSLAVTATVGTKTDQWRRSACKNADRPSMMHRMAMVRTNQPANAPNMPSAAMTLQQTIVGESVLAL
jgi:hypothetical protein